MRKVTGKKKICFVITSEIHYARGKMILEELRRRKDVELQIVVGASAILPSYGNVPELLEKDGFRCAAKILMTIEGGTPLAMAKTTGIGVGEFANIFDALKPDIVVVRGDRYEVLAAAIAAAYLNIPLAHIEGGDVTGTIDESVRHAITKLAHVHLTNSEPARARVIRMGENPRFVFNVGAPEVEYLARNKFKVNNNLVNYRGVGTAIDIKKPFLLAMNHPVTTEYGENKKNTEELLRAIHEVDIPTIWFWPNVDAGADEVSKAIRAFREGKNPQNMRFIKYLPPDDFYGLLAASRCLVGNSSSGIKECSYLGLPVVNIGTRQNSRARGKNVIDVCYEKKVIITAIRKQIKHGGYTRDTLYYQTGTSKKIARILVAARPPVQKYFVE
ncbi:MAG: UDP-N-acetylglucosamine 2-epimerase (hydrolyzing) [Parcubacteria group bacterium]|nr:UDP-N-acetylglucosamine 2-epimerase (hydrolyzing) [Parcubacteria group bacterium]